MGGMPPVPPNGGSPPPNPPPNPPMGGTPPASIGAAVSAPIGGIPPGVSRPPPPTGGAPVAASGVIGGAELPPAGGAAEGGVCSKSLDSINWVKDRMKYVEFRIGFLALQNKKNSVKCNLSFLGRIFFGGKMKKFLLACTIALSICTTFVTFLIYDHVEESAWKPKIKFAIESGKYEVIKENGRTIDELYVVKAYETTFPKRNRNNTTFWGFPLASATSVKIIAAFDTDQEAKEWAESQKLKIKQ